MFDSMIAAIRENTAKMILTVRLRKQADAPPREPGHQAPPAATARVNGKRAHPGLMRLLANRLPHHFWKKFIIGVRSLPNTALPS